MGSRHKALCSVTHLSYLATKKLTRDQYKMQRQKAKGMGIKWFIQKKMLTIELQALEQPKSFPLIFR